MCNLYSMTRGQQAIRELARATRTDPSIGNLAPLGGIYPDYAAPIVRNRDGERELTMARWGMPTPPQFLKGKSDPGVTNVRNVASPHWRRWLGPEARCLVPWTSFSEYDTGPDGRKVPAWFAFDASRPLAFFAGIWSTWTSTRKVREGEVTADIFAFLTCPPNDVVGRIHPQAMPVILTDPAAIETWMMAPWTEARALQRPVEDGALTVVARGEREDGMEAEQASA
jgi:putative SOS response-associated peptidase YedK